jgi:pyrroline-5-carboxylate reductase
MSARAMANKSNSTRKKTSKRSAAQTAPIKDKNSSKQRILIIGIGHMGGALARGLASLSAETPKELFLFDSVQQKLSDLRNQLTQSGASKNAIHVSTELSKNLVQSSDIVVLATKPQDLASVASTLRPLLNSKTLVISLLAAVTTSDIAEALTFKGGVVRAMPNIAATVLSAATALTHNDACTPQQLDQALTIFKSVGTASWTKESNMDAVTGLSGSGPAYIYMIIEALTDGGVKMGLPRVLAHELACQTVLGSAQLVKESGLHPAVLKDQVTTPAGTTIAAIHELEQHGLRAMLMQAVATATERSAAIRKNAVKQVGQ